MGTRLIFLGLPEVTNAVKLSGLIGLLRAVKVFQETTPAYRPYPNRHRWTGREYQGAWENDDEGTRQIAPVTSGEGGPVSGQPDAGGTDSGVATVY